VSTIPIARDGSKAPDGRLLPKEWDDAEKRNKATWNPYRRRFPTDEELRRWYDSPDPRGIATVCGDQSGGLEQVDFDKDAEQLFPAWEHLVEAQRPGLTARLCLLRTPRPGYRVAYRAPDLDPFPGNLTLAQEWYTDEKTGKLKKRTLIETRGEGGYALVPGTPAECHETGRLYEHIAGPALTDLSSLTPEERDILIRCAASLNRAGEEDKGSSRDEEATELPGTVYNTRGPDWEAILKPHGWTCVGKCGQVCYWKRPDKEDRGWSATTGKCHNKDGHELLAVFSSNADPFPGPSAGRLCSVHTKFGAYGLLNHHGDFKAAAQALASEGYGSLPGQDNGAAEGPPEGAGQGERPLEGPHLTDWGNARRMVARHGKELRHCQPWGKWLVWGQGRWKMDDTLATTRCAKSVAVELFRSAKGEIAELGPTGDDGDERRQSRLQQAERTLHWALKSEEAKRINALLDLARSEPGIPIVPAQLDRDPWLFNCKSGTLDLRTGRQREHQREDLITRLCPTAYRPDAPCPLFEQFLGAVFAAEDGRPDGELIAFVQRLLGHCLTGDVTEQKLPIFWGVGANGKSTLVNAICATLGPDYGMKANADLLMSSRGERHPTELASLFRMRLVVASETHQGRGLNESLVKDLTGGERIRARRMREDFWEFDPTHKIVLLTNHKPRVAGMDEAIWRRLRLVPFTTIFWDPADRLAATASRPEHLRQDKQLGARLQQEREGILAWMVRGCLSWQRDGLTMPRRVVEATAAYRQSEDVLARWIAECCITGDTSYRGRSSELHRHYTAWCQQQGEQPMRPNDFGPALQERGYEKLTSNGVWYRGIAVRAREDEAAF
jgi:P4 family phage/plasmid primase-like protien